MKGLIELFNLIALLSIFLIPNLKVKGKSIISLFIISVQVILASILSISVFSGNQINYSYSGSYFTGQIPVIVDYLSAWFILIISFTFLTGAIYGVHYMKQYKDQSSNLTLHAVAYIFAYTTLVDICVIQNGLVFIVVWELMALSSFLLVIFEHYKKETIKAGINFLIQSHVCILFLIFAFIWLKTKTGTFDFTGITQYSSNQPTIVSIGLFSVFFLAFAIKSGFVPFHTWLPLAHPASPSHISGVMSGVIIKIGIYGILRVLLLIRTNFITVGYIILVFSMLTGVYGVMLAILQHNLKKLLAYHSIENIGIIGIGIGLACIGIGYNNSFLIFLGMGGALLHTLNHSLFKSLLFYSAGNIYKYAHSVNIDSLGGLVKKMPKTTLLFLIGSIAICGLPPFNGFISEFLIYMGMFKSLSVEDFSITVLMMFSILSLVLIGGLAIACFTKAFSIVFLGENRARPKNDISSEESSATNPLFIIVLLITLIGIIPSIFLQLISLPINQFINPTAPILGEEISNVGYNLTLIGIYSSIFILIIILIFQLRKLNHKNKSISVSETWGCGYVGSYERMQYTASSYVRSYRKLFEPFFRIIKFKTDPKGIFPGFAHHETHPYDKIEEWFIDKPIDGFRRLLSRFTFLQKGNVQAYILYGFIFISVIVLVPTIYKKILILIEFLNQL